MRSHIPKPGGLRRHWILVYLAGLGVSTGTWVYHDLTTHIPAPDLALHMLATALIGIAITMFWLHARDQRAEIAHNHETIQDLVKTYSLVGEAAKKTENGHNGHGELNGNYLESIPGWPTTGSGRADARSLP